jgi:hypothetical protein
MDVRDPQILLPRLVSTCASSGIAASNLNGSSFSVSSFFKKSSVYYASETSQLIKYHRDLFIAKLSSIQQ